jgi:hypothetical protein
MSGHCPVLGHPGRRRLLRGFGFAAAPTAGDSDASSDRDVDNIILGGYERVPVIRTDRDAWRRS